MKQQIYQWGQTQQTTLVFFHGLGSTGLAFGELANYLSTYHIVSFDLPGHGYAPALTEETAYLPSNVIVLLEKLISQQLGNKNFYLIGHSFGADLALHYAATFPEQIKGIILLDGGYLSSQDLGMTLETELQNIANFCNDVRFPSWDAFLQSEKEELSRWSPQLEAASRAQVREMNGEIRLAISTFTAQSLIKGLDADPFGTKLNRVECPILLLSATKPVELEDVRSKSIKVFQTKLKHVHVDPVPNAGHDIFRDAPEQVAEKLKDWLEYNNG
ncbi:alpha/beta fold hydrolase [Lysinibacillus sp. NPDC097195]|uniref:alpha/beta fold hydrolase n=1 Tax=Lysinibacillus sp. NPDC097195 TaxID=3364141 RepID=UPI0038277C13